MVNDGRTRFADDLTLQELVRLRVENERLREALKDISAECWVSLGSDEEMYKGWRAVAVERVDIARAALKGDE
jgi:hypothetical protein